MKIYKAISSVMAEMAKEGISKDRKNDQQGYKFRGIDDIFNSLAPKLSTHGVCIIPRVLDRSVHERETRNGGVLFYTTLTVAFDFVSAEDASTHTAVVVGEAMDSGDKSSNKAMSAAYKYACLQTFCIPTEGDNDADATTHGDVKPRKSSQSRTPLADRGEGPDDLGGNLKSIREASNIADLRRVFTYAANWAQKQPNHAELLDQITKAKDDRKAELEPAQKEAA